MIKAAVIGLGWWGKTILKNLLNSTVIAPVLAVDPLDQARASASALGIGTASRFEDALANSKVELPVSKTTLVDRLIWAVDIKMRFMYVPLYLAEEFQLQRSQYHRKRRVQGEYQPEIFPNHL